jgi:hypothetical protein
MDGSLFDLLRKVVEELASPDQPRSVPPVLDAEVLEQRPPVARGTHPPRRIGQGHRPTPVAGGSGGQPSNESDPFQRRKSGKEGESHVQPRLGAHLHSSLRKEGSLAQDIEHADERMQAHLSDTFEHQLGDLGTKTGESERSAYAEPKPAGTPVNDLSLIALLRSPQGLRAMILANEVLQRPTDRW